MFSMCGLLCRFLRGWRQSEAVSLMVHAATLQKSSLLVENVQFGNANKSSSTEEKEPNSLFCQPLCGKSEKRHQELLWRDNNKQALLLSPKEKVDLVRWTVFLSSSSDHLEKGARGDEESASQPGASQEGSSNNSRKESMCSQCDNVIAVLLEASYREKGEESLYGHTIMVEQLAEPFAWKARDIFGVIIYTTPAKLVSMIHAFFNDALIIDDDLSIRKILTVDLEGQPSTLSDPSTISRSVTPGPWTNSSEFLTQMEIARASSVVPPDPTEEISISNPNLSKVDSSFSRGMPLSSSFTSSPYKRPPLVNSSGFSPIKRGLASLGKGNSQESDSCPASPLFEEEEELERTQQSKEFLPEDCPPNILVYTGNNAEYYESVKDTLLNIFGLDSYAVYHLTDDLSFKSPWKSNTTLLVVCGDVPTHVSTSFIRYLLTGGKVISICSDFLNVAVPLFGTVEVQDAAVVSMTYNKWKNVQLLHHQHCFHSSPKHKRFSKEVERKPNTGSAVSVEPTFVEITDEFGVHHRLDLKVLAKDDTWGAPSLLVATVSEGNGKALFSQVHLERDPNKSIACDLKGEQLKRSNEARLEILSDLLSRHLGLEARKASGTKELSSSFDYKPAFILGKHEAKQKFLGDLKPHLVGEDLKRQSLSMRFHSKEELCSIPSESFLPVLLNGYPSDFSTVKYFEALQTNVIGRVVVYCQVLSSTMNVICGTPPLDDGVVVITSQQTSGIGRQGNIWLSPMGCAMFSVQLHFPTNSNMGQCLPFLQHLIALSTVKGVNTLPGYENIPLKLKWPNDVYVGPKTKIGGLLVKAFTQRDAVVANVGVGMNLSNDKPTTCINDVIREHNAAHGTKLEELEREVFFASVFNQMEKLLIEFQENGADEVIKEYYKYWLHSNVVVSVQNEVGRKDIATIVGIDQYGFLIAVKDSGEQIVLHPDGNSFNMMEGLISTKSSSS